LRLLRRILVTLAITSAVVFVGVEWIAPVALSYYGARKAPAVARVVPTELKDQTVSQASGSRLSYFGYEFEVPWNDLDEAQTKLYPKDKPTRVVLVFQSGLRLMITALPARELGNAETRENGVVVDLYSDEGGLELIFAEKNYKSSAGVTQPEINRIIQSMHKAI